MSVTDLATCTADHVGSNREAVLEQIEKWGQDEIKTFLDWYYGLGGPDRALFLGLLSLGGGPLTAILMKAIGAAGLEIAIGLIALVALVGYAILFDAMRYCDDKL